ncbi:MULTISPECIES: helix-turn-helix domain-containing protein [Rhodomicrobium]|uniref:MerR family transcriptional regulator n=1 Tax=Rhodomicrobium TaxID=1068 RepID=UPI000B4AECB8|nr:MULTISPECIES: helix-turn-helix domain-containing protein [Rhodomicrobium]
MDFAIGELAKRAGYAVQTLRYFEEIGLMPAAPRTAGGQRRYGDKELRRLLFIKHARELGFSLDVVRSLLQLAAHPDAPCEAADALAASHLQEVDDKIARLQAMREELARMVEACSGGRIAECRVIDVLADHGKCLHETH